MISVDDGEIYYKNKELENFNPVELRREVMMLNQNSLIFAGTIKDNLIKVFKLLEVDIPSDQLLKDVLNSFNLDKRLDKKVNNLSGGEKQRLALARMILLDAEVLLLDEPSSSLDQKTEKIVIEEVINYVRENNKTLIMITHSEEIAKIYSDKVITIDSGRAIKVEEVKG